MSTKQRPRDANGWSIPRPATKAREIYDLFIAGVKMKQIGEQVGRSRAYVSVVITTITRPDNYSTRVRKINQPCKP